MSKSPVRDKNVNQVFYGYIQFIKSPIPKKKPYDREPDKEKMTKVW
jgi:hypothetical protein